MTRIARATFTAYALGNAVGFSYATVPAARAQLFKNDLSAPEIAGLSAITGAAVMIAGSAVAGLGLLLAGREIAAAIVGEAWMWRLLGAALMAPACVWLAVAAGILPNSWIGRLKLQPPGFRMAAAQVGMGMADWAAAAAVLYILLPDHGGWSYFAFMTVFLAAAILGSASGAPAGIGVFEASILALSPDTPHAPAMAAGLIVYRLVWTVAPLIVGAGLLAYDMIVHRPALKTH
jgi:phosphatidylglycerol lysyltransferase